MMTKEARETKALRQAYEWLRDRNGTGVFETNAQVLVAAGERAPFMRATWNSLRDRGGVKIDDKRVTILPGFNARVTPVRYAPEHVPANDGHKVERKPTDE